MHGSVNRLIVILCLVAGACSGSEVATPTTTEPPATTTTTTTGAEPSTVGILDFTATLADGTTFVGSDLAGGDVLFWFWAPS
ncbi:MAG: hypothetical protein H8E59_00525 [Actinobacteria bacterium]|nr:hypothetical protein [Actinomycetota bacterium]